MRFCNGVHQSLDRCGRRRRLHVNIFDKSAQQFTLPSAHLDPPKVVENLSSPVEAELQFNYEPSPFAFWITRRSDPGSTPVFDTRLTSLPSTPIPAFRGRTSDPSLVFDGFPFVFEDRYLQVRTTARCDQLSTRCSPSDSSRRAFLWILTSMDWAKSWPRVASAGTC